MVETKIDKIIIFAKRNLHRFATHSLFKFFFLLSSKFWLETLNVQTFVKFRLLSIYGINKIWDLQKEIYIDLRLIQLFKFFLLLSSKFWLKTLNVQTFVKFRLLSINGIHYIFGFTKRNLHRFATHSIL